MALMEALACGIPTVATRLSGIPELVVDGRTGLLAAPGDPAALAEAIARTLADPKAAERRSAAGGNWSRRSSTSAPLRAADGGAVRALGRTELSRARPRPARRRVPSRTPRARGAGRPRRAARRAPGRRAAARARRASASTSPLGTMIPVSPSITVSGSSPTSLATTARPMVIARWTTPLCEPAMYGAASIRALPNSSGKLVDLEVAVDQRDAPVLGGRPCPDPVGVGVRRRHPRDRQQRLADAARGPGRRPRSAARAPSRAATRRRTGSVRRRSAAAARRPAGARCRAGSRPGSSVAIAGRTPRGCARRGRRRRRAGDTCAAGASAGPASARRHRRRGGFAGRGSWQTAVSFRRPGMRVRASAPAAAGATLRSSVRMTPS